MRAYAGVQPFGTVRDELHSSTTQAILSNGFQNLLYADGKLRNRKNFHPKDFMVQRKKTQSQKLNVFKSFLDSRVK